MYWACKRICGIAEQDREFLSQGVKDYWKAQETSMYKSTIKDVKALKKAYKKSKKDGRAYATKIAKNYAAKQLADWLTADRHRGGFRAEGDICT